MNWLLQVSLRAPRLTLAVVLATTLSLGFFAQRIRVDSSILNLLPGDDPARVYYNDVSRLFGNEEVTVIGVFAPDVFAPEMLARIDRASRALATLDGVRDVISLTTIRGIELTDLGLNTGRLLRELPDTAEEAAAFRAKVLANPLYVGNVVAADGRAAGISVFFETAATDETYQRWIDAEIRRAAADVFGPEHIAITGIPTIKVTGAQLMESDIARFMPMSVLLVTFVLLWAFRTVRGVFVPLLPVLAAVVWTTGIMVLAGSAINMGTLVLTPLLLAIGIAYAIHIMSQYYEAAEARGGSDAVATAMGRVRLPLGIAALTTVCGFATFIPNSIPAIREFGLYSVIGIIAVLVACLTVMPALLSLLSAPPAAGTERTRLGRLATLLERVGRIAVNHRTLVLIAAAVVCVVSVAGIRRINVETDYLHFFRPRSSIRHDNEMIGDRLAGAQPIYIVVQGRTPQSITRLKALAAIHELQEFVASEPKIDRTLSLLNYLAQVRQALGTEPAQPSPVPTKQTEVDQILALMNPADIRSLVSPDLARANVIVRTRLSGSNEVQAFGKRVEEFAAEHLPPTLSIRPTGTLMLLAQSADRLAWGQVMGLWQVLVTLLILMAFLFLSVRVALLSLIPNVLPIIMLFGLMGWLGIDLNVSTSLIAAIAIGLAVDDTIHFLTCFNGELRHSGSQEQATLYAMRSVGRPIVFTSLALGAGFFLVCLSNFAPVRSFGFLAGTTMFTALFADLLVLPALVTSTRIITLWDLLFLKLGAEPHKRIPMFAGLRPFQARIAVLMGRLASARKGDFIIRQGEIGRELYVLLNGRAEVRLGGTSRVLRALQGGDEIGEMALVRARPRSADVVAVEDCEYVVLDEHFLERLKRRYPRIAATVFLNLTRILSERLESTTGQLADDIASTSTATESGR